MFDKVNKLVINLISFTLINIEVFNKADNK